MQNDERDRDPESTEHIDEATTEPTDEATTEPEPQPTGDATAADARPADEPPAADEAASWPSEEPTGEQAAAADAGESSDEFETVPSGTRPATSAEMHEAPSWPDAEPIPSQQAGAETEPGPAAEGEGDAGEGPPPSEVEAYPASAAAVPETEPAPTAAHSVPATSEVGESTQCPRCGAENRPGIAFCRNCGQRLVAAGVATTVQRPGAPEGTQQCPRCGTHNRAGVAFCQNCGANLRTAASPAPGYVPPAAERVAGPAATPAEARTEVHGGAVLGPIVLLIGAAGLVTAWLLPFPYGSGSLWERSFGTSGGYGIAFWDGFSTIGSLLEQVYFVLAASVPLLVLGLLVLAVAGFLRAAPGGAQRIGLVLALLWAVALAGLFVVVEVAGGWNGDLVGLLRDMSPGGIILFLASLIVLIGGLTRLARS